MGEVLSAIISAESAQTLLARITDLAGDILTPDAVSTVSVEVFDRNTRLQIGATINPSPSAVIAATLQTTAVWTQDSTGFNFSIVIPGTYFPAGGTTYRVEVTITPIGGNPFKALWDLPAIEVFS
jgi:hypothetical protein